jgi:poly(A) polymerase
MHSPVVDTLARTLGVTPPISVAESTEREKEVTATLLEELRSQRSFESEEESRNRCVLTVIPTTARALMSGYHELALTYFLALFRREIVLGRVAALVKKFVKQISIKNGLSEAAAAAAGGKIFTFGSYRLGVHGPGSDIDTLCVVPKHVSREDFFETFEEMLKGMEGVTEVSVSSSVWFR